MSLREKIEENVNSALKEKKEIEISVLRMLLAVVLNKEKEKRYKFFNTEPEMTEPELVEKSQLNNEEIIEVISSEVKKRKEAILGFEKGNRMDMAEKEKTEIEILKNYLPEQISEEEIKKLAEEAVKKTGAKEAKDMGKVMAELMPKVKGKADGNAVSQIVKELLT